jgi:hypothetical protein
MSFMWSLAFREIAMADEIHVVGVSFSAGDFELRWILREAVVLREPSSRLRVVLVNPSAPDREAGSRVFSGIPGHRIDPFERVDDYLKHF